MLQGRPKPGCETDRLHPPYRGINWACGQEASIRLMNLALAALILDTWDDPSPTMRWLVEAHARRIRPTLSYALGQDNNHGTAETCGPTSQVAGETLVDAGRSQV